MKPTDEQQAALDAFATGEDVVLEAGAGTGKTSTLRLLGKSTDDRGTYVAYNKSIADEASGTFPSHVQCRTAHSLAFRAVGREYRDRMDGGFQPLWKVAKFLGIDAPLQAGSRTLPYTTLARLTQEMVDNFCNSADREITAQHRPYVDGLVTYDDAGNVEHDYHHELGKVLLPYAEKAWDDLVDSTKVDSPLRFKHDHYLKCQPGGTQVLLANGKQIDIEDVQVGDEVVSWTPGPHTGRIRKSGSRVSHIGQREYWGPLISATVLAAEPVDGQLPEVKTSRYTDDHICISLIGDALDGKTVVYLMRRGNQYRIGRTPWRYGSQDNTLGIVTRARMQGADAVWVLDAYDTEEGAALSEAWTAHVFSIPTWQFEAPNQAMPLDAFWRHVGTNEYEARRCLQQFGRRIEYPLWEKATSPRLWCRAPIEIRACNLMSGMRLLQVDRIKPNANGELIPSTRSRAWQRAEISRHGWQGTVYSIEVDGDHTYVADGLLTHNCWQLNDPVIRTDYILFDEAQDANPVIASIVLQQDCQRVMVGDRAQAIYGWRGAVDAMESFEAAYRLYLSQSFRFGPAVAEFANTWLEKLDTPLRLRGYEPIESSIGSLDTPRALLCRSNAGALDALLRYQAADVKAHLVGGANDIGRFCKAVLELQTTGKTAHRDLIAFTSWEEVVQYVKDDKKGAGDLATWVSIIDRYGVETVSNAIANQHPHEDTAEVTLSTAHKAKGREWTTVRIADDFAPPVDKQTGEIKDLSAPDVMLRYVAVTRAMNVLDPGPLVQVSAPTPDDDVEEAVA